MESAPPQTPTGYAFLTKSRPTFNEIFAIANIMPSTTSIAIQPPTHQTLCYTLLRSDHSNHKLRPPLSPPCSSKSKLGHSRSYTLQTNQPPSHAFRYAFPTLFLHFNHHSTSFSPQLVNQKKVINSIQGKQHFRHSQATL